MRISSCLFSSCFTSIFVVSALTPQAAALQPSSLIKIQVCQNKDCCSRWKLKTPLPDVLHDLVDTSDSYCGVKVSIETTSCLSQCDQGPNLCVKTNDQLSDMYFNGIQDVVALVTQLDEKLSITIPSKILAAVNVFEKAQSGKIKVYLECCGKCRCFAKVERLHLIESPTTEINIPSVCLVLFVAKRKMYRWILVN
jgi:(2Fe-2S) ferredoxin